MIKRLYLTWQGGYNLFYMDIFTPQTVDGNNISVLTSAATLYSLVDTASPASTTKYPADADALDITPEDGNVRITFHTNLTPTAALGKILYQGMTYHFRNRRIKDMKLIATGAAAVKCSVTVGQSHPEEVDSTSGGGAGAAAGTGTQLDAATTSASGTVAALTTVGGVALRAANANRRVCYMQNNGSDDVYYGAGTVDATFPKMVPGGEAWWVSQEALKVLSASGSQNIAYHDFINS